MKMIVAADEKGGIGKDGGLLTHLPTDLRYFKTLTLGGVVVMGRTTLESLPGGKPLKGRRNIVLSRTLPEGDRYEVCRSLEELMDLIKDKNSDDVFVIGGGQIYRQLMPYCDAAFVTEIEGDLKADTVITLPRDLPEWVKIWESMPCYENGKTYRFVSYKNNRRMKCNTK